MKLRHPSLWIVVIALLGGLALAASAIIETEHLRIEERSTPEANVIIVTDVQRNGDNVAVVGGPRVYTEQRR